MNPKINKDKIYHILKNPRKIKQGFEYILDHVKHSPRQLMFKRKYSTNPYIPNEDWDNLIILDACRHDVLKELEYFENIDYKILKSSNSQEFIEKYLDPYVFDDTVYVTANPFGAQLSNTFCDLYSTIENNNSNDEGVTKNWNPQSVYQSAIEANNEYPNKRLIIHFMQPHAPYFSEEATKLRKSLRKRGYKFWAWDENVKIEQTDNDKVLHNLLDATQQGLISGNQLKRLYIENLEFVLPYVQKLSDRLIGKTVVTADHGEMLGENKRFTPNSMSIGHGYGIYTEELRKVPWICLDYDVRKDIKPDDMKDENVEIEIEKQLKALGYKG